mmetsp:Transcript_18262/g.52070  ORF Transcript_18262/g.52070 Transcript_18262/m.52070 type:complete len:92 (+) Transcript_18262:1832-2107(+)
MSANEVVNECPLRVSVGGGREVWYGVVWCGVRCMYGAVCTGSQAAVGCGCCMLMYVYHTYGGLFASSIDEMNGVLDRAGWGKAGGWMMCRL